METLLTAISKLQIESLEYPFALILLILLPLYCLYAYKHSDVAFRRLTIPSLQYKDTKDFLTLHPSPKPLLRMQFLRRSRRFIAAMVTLIFSGIAFVCLTIAIAKPYGGTTHETKTEGIDIYFTLDMSASMKAYDLALDEIQARYKLDVYTPNRFDQARDTILKFIQTRADRCYDHSQALARCDRVGITLFGQQAFIDVPLTINYDILSDHLKKRRIDDIDATQSAIGDGLMRAIASLRHSPAKSKNIILLSDGDKRGGRISISQAVAAARQYGIKIFPIMIGNGNTAILAQPNPGGYLTFHEAEFPVHFELLDTIAKETGGQAYRGSTNNDFTQQLDDILDRLEPHVSKEMRRDNQLDLSLYFVVFAFVFATMAYGVYITLIRQYP